ncbi:MAG TPA: LysR substrate-binding domain-containing protein [Rhizomicrobium sp.]|jgi:DNA-binding transcriptional LysR family regulator
MQDLNDIAFFAAVVENKGFSAAARALGLPKSTLSRRVGQLEERLGMRLLERSTRHFRLTDAGNSYFQKARTILDALDAADRELAQMRSGPSGIVRLAAPLASAQYLLPQILPDFLKRYPMIKVQVMVTDRPVDLFEDKIDIAIRARTDLGNEMLTMRKLATAYRVLVASPDFAAQHNINGDDPKILSGLAFLSSNESAVRQSVTLVGPSGERQDVAFEPRLWTTDFNLVRESAIAGLGIAFLPLQVVQPALDDGRLVRVLPGWQSEAATMHLVFASQKSLTPAGRLLVEYLAKHMEPAIQRGMGR